MIHTYDIYCPYELPLDKDNNEVMFMFMEDKYHCIHGCVLGSGTDCKRLLIQTGGLEMNLNFITANICHLTLQDSLEYAPPPTSS